MKSLLITLFSLFAIAELAIAQSSGYSNVANGESSKVKKTEISPKDPTKLNDSLKQIALTAEIDQLRAELAKARETEAAIAQLKAKSESNQAQIDQLKVDNARAKIAGTVNRPVDNTLVISQLKARSDSNQVQIDQLIAELAKAKETEAAIAQLKAKSESNQAQIDQLKVDNARTKIAGTVNRPVDNTLMIGQLKARSDSNQVQIDQLKRELAKDKETETAIENNRRAKDSVLRHFLISETDALLTQLKAKSDTNQLQFEGLKAELENTKAAKSTSGSNKENDAEIARLKERSDIYQTQIDQLKEELAKAKDAERARKSSDSLALVNSQSANEKFAQLKAKSESNQAQIDQLKVDNARTKISGTLTSPATDNTLAIGQLKVKSDSSQAQIDRLKTELAKVKNTEPKAPPASENGELIAQLKTQSENNQAQIDMLVEIITKTKEEKPKAATSKETDDLAKMQATKNYDELIAQLKTQSDNNQAQIDKLVEAVSKTRDEMAKSTDSKKAETLDKNPPANDYGDLITQLKTQSDNNQAQIDMLVETITKTREEQSKSTKPVNSKKEVQVDKEVLGVQVAEKSNSNVEIEKLDPEIEKTKKTETEQLLPAESVPGMNSPKNNDFVDEKGEPASNGFYIVIGTFGSKENAQRFKATNILKGHGNTKIIQNKNTKMYNIFALKTNNKKDADLERAKYKREYSNVWILNLE